MFRDNVMYDRFSAKTQWYNTNFHSSTKLTQFKALYGRDSLTLLFHATIHSTVKDVNLMSEERERSTIGQVEKQFSEGQR